MKYLGAISDDYDLVNKKYVDSKTAAYPYLQATGDYAESQSLTENTLAQITLTANGQIAFGEGLSVVDGGIQVAGDGTYKTTGNIKVRTTSSGTTYRMEAQIRTGVDFANSSVSYSNIIGGTEDAYFDIPLPSKMLDLSEDDIVFLAVRSLDGNASAYPSSIDTFLLVEQVASTGAAGIQQAINYLPNADTTEY